MPKQRADADTGASLKRVYVLGSLLLNFFLWGIAVAMFNAGHGLSIAHPGRRRSSIVFLVSSIVVFFVSAVTTLPRVFSVIAWICTNRTWYLLVIFAANGSVALLMWYMKKVEAELNSGRAFKQRKH